MGFEWPLHRLLHVTDKRELAIKAELFGLSRQIARAEEELHRRRDMVRMLLDDLGTMPLEERLGRQDVLMRCHKAEQATMQRIREQIAQWTEQREQRTADLVKLMAKKDTLQKMQDRARQSYQRYLDRREQERADAMYQMGFARQKQTGPRRQLA